MNSLRQYVFPNTNNSVYVAACEQLADDRTPFELSFNKDGRAVITLNPNDFLPGHEDENEWWSTEEWMEQVAATVG